jgi:hypothetical protein
MFDQINGSSAPNTREATYRSERNARNIRGANADAHVYRTGTDISSRKTVERPNWRDHCQVGVGFLLMCAIAVCGLEVFMRLCANTAMIR